MRTIGLISMHIHVNNKLYYDLLNFLKSCLDFDTEDGDIVGVLNMLYGMEDYINMIKVESMFNYEMSIEFPVLCRQIKLFNECLQEESSVELERLILLLESIQKVALEKGFTKLEVYGYED